MRRLWLPLLIVLASDAYVLVGVARNRTGTPQARVELAPGDFDVVRLGDENTGLEIRLRIGKVLPEPSFAEGQRRVKAFGYDREIRSRLAPAKPGFAALEHRPGVEALTVSDCAPDARTLRQRYTFVTRAIVHPSWTAGKIVDVRPWVEPQSIHVPLPYSRVLSRPGEHRVTLCYGSRYEPWICEAR